MADLKLEDEPGRLAALRRYEILDTPREGPFDRITALVRAVLDVPIAAVTLIDSDRQWFKSCVGLDATETTRDVSFCTHTIQNSKPMYIPDARLDARFESNPLVTQPPHIVSYLGVPLATPDGYNLGALCAIDTRPRTYTPEQIEVLKSFAAIVTDEMELRRLAKIDHLTGALTRRGFCLELEKAISRFVRHGGVSALVLFDVDHFKRVNDSYGHPAGDIALKSVAARIASRLRTSDVLGRVGGEEFGILVSDAGPEAALKCAERFRRDIEALVVEHDPPLKLTASFGVAVVDREAVTPERWLGRADEGLYAAKRGGRNRSCFAPDTEPAR